MHTTQQNADTTHTTQPTRRHTRQNLVHVGALTDAQHATTTIYHTPPRGHTHAHHTCVGLPTRHTNHSKLCRFAKQVHRQRNLAVTEPPIALAPPRCNQQSLQLRHAHLSNVARLSQLCADTCRRSIKNTYVHLWSGWQRCTTTLG